MSIREMDAGTATEIHVQRFSVEFEYPVVFTRDVFAPENPILADVLARAGTGRHRAAVFLDSGIAATVPDFATKIHRYARNRPEALQIVGDVVTVPGGETIKTDPGAVELLMGQLAERRIDRHSFAIAIGGGAVLDAVGYAAAIFHRGVRHIRLPTTVLAQDDSGVGVKNAVNAMGLKNLVGTFAPPFAVINDSLFLDRLPARERLGGMAEAVKVALIRDAAFFRWLEAEADALARFDRAVLDALIRRSATLHMHQIARGGDPFERGSARPLDFGHWSAHRLEAMTGHELGHGEAVAIGIALDSRYSVLAGLLAPGEEARVLRLLRRLGLPLWHDALDARGPDGRLSLLKGLAQFREHLGGELTVTLLAAVGSGVEVHEIRDDLVADAIGWLRGNRP